METEIIRIRRSRTGRTKATSAALRMIRSTRCPSLRGRPRDLGEARAMAPSIRSEFQIAPTTVVSNRRRVDLLGSIRGTARMETPIPAARTGKVSRSRRKFIVRATQVRPCPVRHRRPRHARLPRVAAVKPGVSSNAEGLVES